MHCQATITSVLLVFMNVSFCQPSAVADDDSAYYHAGELAGSLKSDRPLAIYHSDPEHLWNRLFAAFYTRTSNLRGEPDGEPIHRIEGGDYIDFLAWGGSDYWSAPDTLARLNRLVDEFLENNGQGMIDEPLKRAVMLRDLWAGYDYFVGQNIRRVGKLETRRSRDVLCRKLARVISLLALKANQIEELPDTYLEAIASGDFAKEQDFDSADYLPHGLLTKPEEWVEIDFYQPDLHEDLYDRFLTLHAKAYRGRSYFRIFYRFPAGRGEVASYLKQLKKTGIDWRQAAQDGFILLKKDAPQIPVGTEVALVQFMMTLNDELLPVPTKIVESVRHRAFRNVDGSSVPDANTGVGMHVMEYTLKRRLLFDDLRAGGLQREPDDAALYRIIFQPDDAPDWGTNGRQVLFQQCANCHMTPNATRSGVHSMPSIVHMGGFDAGAQLGIVHPLQSGRDRVHANRTARWKAQHETYRRLLEYLDR
jgi:hypothetical protein